ncbi:MAG: SHOCT domain-containing protein [Candidatus Paceibacterota bacterium]
MMYYYGSFFPFNFLGPLLMILFWGAIIYTVFLIVRKTSSQGDNTRAYDRSMEILKERYAKGEITKHEFEAMKKDLS